MAEEFKKFYPEYAYKVKVVHLASMSNTANITSNKLNRIKNDIKIRGKYILYPTNIHSHKNIGPLLTALAILRKMGKDISLVLTGPKTDLINGKACDIGLIKQERDKDVFGMGYVSNDEMDSLIQCAEVVVSTSLYEAGNGPGMEAWAAGVPVAMSNIPPFVEHLKVQNVKAEIFDPRSPDDIADKINNILSNPDKAKSGAKYSQSALEQYTWESVALKYLNIFERTIRGN
jgi:glycosyltransferase involved in cell wall biosynthesis